MHEFLVSVVAFFVLVGVMVIVHELGHFTVAKLCGVRVEAFAFGFGPRLFGFKYGETDYKVCLLPLGGFVKMTGEMAEQNLEAPGKSSTDKATSLPISSLAYKVEQGMGEATEETPANSGTPVYDPGAFTSHPRWQRILIGLAGPAANFLLALFLMTVYFGFINEVPAVEVKTTTVEWVAPNTAAADAGLQPGDVISGFDGVSNPDWEKVYERAKLNANQTVAVTVQRGGSTANLSFHVPNSAKNDDFDISDAGLLPQYMPGPIGVAEIAPGTPAEKAGLRAGDKITSVDGHPFHTVSTLLAYMQAQQGKPMALVVDRNGNSIAMTAEPAKLDTSYKLGFTAAGSMAIRKDPMSLDRALTKSIGFCESNSLLVVEVLQRLFTHKVAVTQLSGPVGIARMAGEAAEMKEWQPKFGLAVVISLNLGILNLLPFPILDGGMILFLLIESVMRRDINMEIKERIYQVAFVLIMAFTVFIVFSDISKLPLFSHVKP